MVGSASAKIKGKMSRMLAAKAALSIRVDALGEDMNADLGIAHRAKLERRARELEEGKSRRISGPGKLTPKWEKYENKSQVRTYNETADSTIPAVTPKKRKFEDDDDEPEVKHKIVKVEPEIKTNGDVESSGKKKKKKRKSEAADESMEVEPTSQTPNSEKKKKKKKKVKEEEDSD